MSPIPEIVFIIIKTCVSGYYWDMRYLSVAIEYHVLVEPEPIERERGGKWGRQLN